MSRRTILLLFFAAALVVGPAGRLAGQGTPASASGPQFLAMSPKTKRLVDASNASVFRRRLSVSFTRTPAEAALAEIARQAGFDLLYGAGVVPADRRVTLQAEGITVAAALTQVLLDTGLDVVLQDKNRLGVVQRSGIQALKARTGMIVGAVSNAKTGEAIRGAEVFLRGTKWKTTTDTTGRYRLADVDTGGHTLVVRRVGYTVYSQPVTVRDGRTDTVNVALAPAVVRLDELVSTATGQRRRLHVPNDITTLNADSIVRNQPIASITDLLDTRVPGLTVQRTSGAPGDPARLRLRGAGSPSLNNDPIVFVDGQQIYAEQSDERNTNGGFPKPSPLDYLDPSVIEKVEVVKGPSATALYGPNAANGVIVITTKRGRAGPPRWTFSGDYGRKTLAGTYPDLLVRWGHRLNFQEAVPCPLLGRTNKDPSFPTQHCEGTDSLKTYQMLNDPALTVLDKGRNSAVRLGVSGGTQSLTYSVNGSYADEYGMFTLPDYEVERYRTVEGIDPPDWMRRPQKFKHWGVQTSLVANLGSKASVTLTNNFARLVQQRSPLERELRDVVSTFLEPSTGVYYGLSDGQLGPGPVDYALDSYYHRIRSAVTTFTSGVTLDWRARSWLKFNANAGLNVDNGFDEQFRPRSRDTTTSADAVGRLTFGNPTSVVSTVRAWATATAPLGRGLHLTFTSGVDYLGRAIKDFRGSSSNIPFGTEDNGRIGHGVTRTVKDDATFGWFVAPSLSHPRFNVDVALRLDGGSSYGSNVNGFKLPAFPKLGFSYLLSDEPFFPFKSLFQSFRVRVGYGRAGRQPGPTERLRLYGSDELGLADGTVEEIVRLSTFGNTELRPERTTEWEGGFDADMFDSRINLIFSGFRKTTDDALLAVALPGSVAGGGEIMRNIGVIRNTGMEMTVGAQLLRTTSMALGTDLMVSRRRDMVVRLGPGVDPFFAQSEDLFGDGWGTRVAPGYPLFGRWVRPLVGYSDVNNNGVLEDAEVVRGDTMVYVGQQQPDYELTLRPYMRLWGGAFTVTAGIKHDGGVSQMNEVAQLLSVFSRGTNDPSASLAEQFTTGQATNSRFNWIQTISSTRLNDLSVMYTVPATFARRIGAQRLSVAVQGVNLGLWTNYRGLDPNVNSFATGNSVVDRGVLPEPRTWQLRINAEY